jgi:hypothetical protein
VSTIGPALWTRDLPGAARSCAGLPDLPRSCGLERGGPGRQSNDPVVRAAGSGRDRDVWQLCTVGIS